MNTPINIYPFIHNQIRFKNSADEGELYLELEKDLQDLEKKSKNWLTSSNFKNQKDISEEVLSRVFNLKLNIAKWLDHKQISIEELHKSFEEMYPEEEKFESDSLSNLWENLQFTNRTGLKIYRSIINHDYTGEDYSTLVEKLPSDNIQFQQFKYVLLMHDSPQLVQFLHFLENNLKLEFAIIAAFQVLQNHDSYDESVIDELSWFIVDTTQEVGAGAIELGIIRTKAVQENFENLYRKPDENQLKDQHALAEVGINYWAENLEEWE